MLAPLLRAVLLQCMRVKSLCHIRSTANPNSEMVAEVACITDPQAAWVRSTMTEAKIQALVDRGLLRPKTEVEWRAAAREEFPSKDIKEQVVFASFFERGFNLPAGDFFRGLLYYYRLVLVHLVPNSITIVSTFIHFCEAYLGIPPHFTLWRYFLCVKSTSKRLGPMGVVMFNLRSCLKVEWIDSDLPDHTAGWRSEWFYIADQIPGLSRRTSHKPVKISVWDLGLPTHNLEDLKGVLEPSFCRRMIQPIKDRVHPAYEYCGQLYPTRKVNRKVSKEEMAARVSQMYSGKVKVKKCPKAHSLKRPADPVKS
jgi:hypothetical protein